MTTVLDTMGDSTDIHSPVGCILGVLKQMHPEVIAARNVSAAMVNRLLVLELLMAKSPDPEDSRCGGERNTPLGKA